MAAQKPDTPASTEMLDPEDVEESVKRAAERAAEERATILSAEEMAAQKPETPAATEAFDPDEMEAAAQRAAERAATTRGQPIDAQQMAEEKPITPEETAKIDPSMLPPTSTREMASTKPPTRDATSELGSVEAAAKMAAEKPASPLSTVEAAPEPGAVDTPLIEEEPESKGVAEIAEVHAVEEKGITAEVETMELRPDELESIAPDRLTLLEGIGPKISAALVNAGISSYSRLADTPEEDLREILQKAGVRLSPTLPTWAEQARFAARGDWDGLKAFQAKIGRSGKVEE
jgi:predicted flap endonuclease-1-like 5' DNA nuclease